MDAAEKFTCGNSCRWRFGGGSNQLTCYHMICMPSSAQKSLHRINLFTLPAIQNFCPRRPALQGRFWYYFIFYFDPGNLVSNTILLLISWFSSTFNKTRLDTADLVYATQHIIQNNACFNLNVCALSSLSILFVTTPSALYKKKSVLEVIFCCLCNADGLMQQEQGFNY